ncbi:MAG: YggT family protein [Pseudomonadota bacterium]
MSGLLVILDPVIRIIVYALNIYVWLIIISAIMSWLVQFNVINSQNQFVNMIGRFLWQITEPALRPIRRFMPNLGGIDISPVILILLIYFIQMVLQNFLQYLYTG